MSQTLEGLTESIEREADRQAKSEAIQQQVRATEENGTDGFDDEKVKLIPTPKFCDAGSLGTLLPINMADETVNILAKYSQEFDFIDFIREKLNYDSRIAVAQYFKSEQIDALVLAIKSFEQGNAFILGDMAGIGKGRVCAGILRYAYQQGLVPVFLTHKPYLFSDIYRDFEDIGGFGVTLARVDKSTDRPTSSGRIIMPSPFIMHKDGAILSDEIDPNTLNKVAYAEPMSPKEVLRFCRDVIKKDQKFTFPFKFKRFLGTPEETTVKFDSVFMPYSTLSQTQESSAGIDKVNFLNTIAPRSIFVFDECHNASSAEGTNILKRAKPLVEKSKACLFSSATYAKNSSVFGLYIIKTALRTAVPTLDSITDALKVGGENVSEYIASGLVFSGQMIRRERSFSDCEKITEYVGSKRIKNKITGKVDYIKVNEKEQRDFYDEAIGYFKELRDFSKSDHASKAILNSIIRKCVSQGKAVITPEQFEEAKTKDAPEQATFIQQNLGNWVISYKTDSISRYKASFRENLFLALKAKFTGDQIIDNLVNSRDYINIDGTPMSTPLKPLVAIRNTGERVFSELQLQEGQELKNDFSEYLRAIYNRLFTGTFTLRKIDSNIFLTLTECTSQKFKFTTKSMEFAVIGDDFTPDGKAELDRIQSLLSNYQSSLPFSIIDYLRDVVESTIRPDNYYKPNGEPKYGRAASKYFKFGEATSRSYMLIRKTNDINNPDYDKFIYVKNDRERRITDVFKNFNNGDIDVMLLNIVASTGGSAQSSPKEGIDTRQRNMLVVQFELDINIEVQKRGRINRTAQLNNPVYTYIVTKIPVEVRTYLMFRKKLRKLDANTSANQTASAEGSELTDVSGKKIEDILNSYGYDVFIKEFIVMPSNDPYKQIFDKMRSKANRYGNTSKMGKAEEDEYHIQQFISFTNELELWPVDFQESFFNQMNELYADRIEYLIANNQYQLELETKPYKASLKQRVVLEINSGTTIFSYPLFLDDYWTLDTRLPWPKDKIDKKASEYASNIKPGATEQQAYGQLLKDIIDEHTAKKDDVIAAYIAKHQPTAIDYPDPVKLASVQANFDIELSIYKKFQESRYNSFIDLINYYEPKKPIRYKQGDGIFLGYNIKDKKRLDKYASSNIEFVFCFINETPVLRMKYSSNSWELMNIRDYTIEYETQDIREYNVAVTAVRTPQQIQAEIITRRNAFHKRVEEWKPNLTKRIVRRFLSGNILSGIVYAYERDYEWVLTRFTQINGSKTTALEIKADTDKISTPGTKLNTNNIDLSIACNSKEFLTYLADLPPSDYLNKNVLPVWNVEKGLIIDSSICITKTVVNIKMPDGSVDTSKGDEIVNIEFVQPYLTFPDPKDKNKTLRKDYTATGKGSGLFSPIWHDDALLSKYAKFLDKSAPDRQSIWYANKFKQTRLTGYEKDRMKRYEEQAKEAFESVYADVDFANKSVGKGSTRPVLVFKDQYSVRMKRYSFNLDSDAAELKVFLKTVYDKYELCFNFRSSNVDYYNKTIDNDLYDPAAKDSKAHKQMTFPEGEYEYAFISNTAQDVKNRIPSVIEFTGNTRYGGVKLKYPLKPTELAAYNVTPYKIPYDILIKLSYSTLNDIDKVEFLKKIERMAQDDMSDDAIGDEVLDYLSSRTVGPTYLFGYVAPRTSDYGKLYKQFVLNKDVNELIIDTTDADIIPDAPKDKVTFEDAEKFLMTLEP